MRKLLLATTCAVCVSTAPTLAKPPLAAPSPTFAWTGCYLGGSLGSGWGRKDFTDTLFTPGSPGIAKPASPMAATSGPVAGGQVGCNYQFAPSWVAGVELWDAWANIEGTSDPFFSGKALFKAQTDWMATATARLGYTTPDHWLLYLKGGAAWAGDKYQMPGTFLGTPFNFTGSQTRFGWTIGGGVEWPFLKDWSARFEYAYYDFGTHSLTLVDPRRFGAVAVTDPSSIKQRIGTLMFGINYRFWAGMLPVGTSP